LERLKRELPSTGTTELERLIEEIEKTLRSDSPESLSDLEGAQMDVGSIGTFCYKGLNRLWPRKLHACLRFMGLKAKTEKVDATDTSSEEENAPPLVIVRCVQPVSGISLYKEVFFFCMDIITDLKQLHDLYIAGHHIFGAIMLFIFSGSLTLQLLRCHWCELFRQTKKTLEQKVKTDEYLDILQWEKGFESHLALMLTAYSLRFSMTGADSILTGYVGMLLSLYNFSSYVFQRAVLKS